MPAVPSLARPHHPCASDSPVSCQQDALQEADPGTYWPGVASPREPSLNRCGALIPRDDERLVRVVEELGEEANGHAAELKVVAIPDDVQWVIARVDGVEHVSEVHRKWA